jgi:hypothetical protein
MLNTRESGSNMELLDIERALAALDVELKLCRVIYLLQKHGADQPRVPAGSSEGGQWTSGGGTEQGRDAESGSPEEGRSASDGSDPAQSYAIDLGEEEHRGGHTIERHVARSEADLKIEVQQVAQDMVDTGQYPHGLSRGSFTSLESATELVNSTLLQNRDRVDRVASGERGGDIVTAGFHSPTGYEAFLPTPESIPYVRDTYGVRVLIARDPRSSSGFRVHTAYPIE